MVYRSVNSLSSISHEVANAFQCLISGLHFSPFFGRYAASLLHARLEASCVLTVEDRCFFNRSCHNKYVFKLNIRGPKLRLSESNDACINCRAGAVSRLSRRKGTENNSNKLHLGRELTLFPHKYFAFCQERRYIEDALSGGQ